jgi:hypothetical protein
MIDKKGKLFGKVSVVDLFVLVVVVVAVVFIYNNMGVAAITSATRGEALTMKFHTEFAVDDIVAALREGAPVIDWERRVELGRITGIEVSYGYQFITNEDGVLIKAPRPGYSSIEIQTSLRGVIQDTSAIIDGNRYNVGGSSSFIVGDTLMFMRISAIERGQ